MEGAGRIDPRDYRKVQSLSNANFGKVYLWEHKTKPELTLAVKRIANDARHADGTRKGQGLLECLTAASLDEDPVLEIGASMYMSGHSCPTLIRLRGCWMDEDYTYLATEFCEGGELFSQLVKRGFFREEEAKGHICDLLGAIEYMHAKLGLAHRDVSLENVLLGSDKRARLMDFGMSHAIHAPGRCSPILATGCAGKENYRAPEMYPRGRFARKEYAADKTDIWAVGICAYLLLVGKPLWRNANEYLELINQKTAGSFIYVMHHGYKKLFNAWSLGLSDNALDFIAVMLCLDPAQRPSASEALHHPWLCSTPYSDNVV